jgi:hypothetical protein
LASVTQKMRAHHPGKNAAFILEAALSKVRAEHKPLVQQKASTRKLPEKIVTLFTPQKAKLHGNSKPVIENAPPQDSQSLSEADGFLALEVRSNLAENDDAGRYYDDTDTAVGTSFVPLLDNPSNVVDFEQLLSTPGASPLVWVDYARLVCGSHSSLRLLRKSTEDHVDSVLEIFSRALETSRTAPVLWYCYLSVFPLRAQSADEIDQYCKHAQQFSDGQNPILLSQLSQLSRSAASRRDLLTSAFRSTMNSNPLRSRVMLGRLYEYVKYCCEAGDQAHSVSAEIDSALQQLLGAPSHNEEDQLLIVSCLTLKAFITAEGAVPPRECVFAILNQEFFSSPPLPWRRQSNNDIANDAALSVFHEGIQFCMRMGYQHSADVVSYIATSCASQRHGDNTAAQILGLMPASGPLHFMQRIRLSADPFSMRSELLVSDLRTDSRLWFFLIQRCCNDAIRDDASRVRSLFVDAVSSLCPGVSREDGAPYLRALFGRALGMPPSIFIPSFAEPLTKGLFKDDPWMWLIFASLEALQGQTSLVEEIFQSALALFKQDISRESHSVLNLEYLQFRALTVSVPSLLSSTSSFLSEWNPIDDRWSNESLSCLLSPLHVSPADSQKLVTFLDLFEFENYGPLDAVLELVSPALPQHLLFDFLFRICKLFPRHVPVVIRHAQYAYRFGNAESGRKSLQAALKYNPSSVELWSTLIGLEATFSSDTNRLVELKSLVEEALTYVPHSVLIRSWSAGLGSV